jgi:HSP20 family protein
MTVELLMGECGSEPASRHKPTNRGGQVMTGFDLFREMEHFTREMDDVFRGLGFGRPEMSAAPVLGRFPRIKLREDKEHFYVQALLPGIDPKELEMTVLKGTLTLSGERRGISAEGATWHRRERSVGKFLRAIDIPAEIDINKVKADFRNGLLTVTLPKAESERPKRIEVTTA